MRTGDHRIRDVGDNAMISITGIESTELTT